MRRPSGPEGGIFRISCILRTGCPARGMLMVSVTAPRAIDSEAWAKPFFIHGRAWTAKHKPKRLNAFFCEDESEETWGWLA